jgi:hypothetical protein
VPAKVNDSEAGKSKVRMRAPKVIVELGTLAGPQRSGLSLIALFRRADKFGLPAPHNRRLLRVTNGKALQEHIVSGSPSISAEQLDGVRS